MKKFKVTRYFNRDSFFTVIPTIKIYCYFGSKDNDAYFDIEFDWLMWFGGWMFNEVTPTT